MDTHLHPGLVEHSLIDHAFRDARAALARGERAEVSEAVSALAAVILAHFDLEEEELDSFARIDAAEASALSAEHDALRATLADIEIAATSGTLTRSAIAVFRAQFAVHEVREEKYLYRCLTGFARRRPSL